VRCLILLSVAKDKVKKRGLRTSELVCLQHLEEEQVLVPGILNIVTVRLRKVSHVPGAVVKRRGRTGCREQRGAALATDEKCPLIAGRMPVDLAHPARLDGHDSRREITGDGEGDGIHDLDGSAGDFVGGLLGEVVRVALRSGDDSRCRRDVLGLDVLGGWGAREDVQFVLGKVFE
jgi:hypothetical protein